MAKDSKKKKKIKEASQSDGIDVDGLQKQVSLLGRSLRESETLNKTYIFQIGDSERRHEKELTKVGKQLLQQRRNNKEMEKKVSRVNQIEDEIIKLYLEVKDRSTEVVREKHEQLRLIEDEKEKIELKKMNPLIVLDKLKGSLRFLISFKEDYENELKDQIHRKMTDAEKRLKECKKQLKQSELQKEEYKLNAAKAIEEKNEAIEAKRETIEESNIRMRRLQKDNERLIDEIKKGESIIADLNAKLDNRDKILRHREIQLMRITQLESQIQKSKLKHQFDQNKMKSEMFKSKQSYESQLSFFNKLKAEKKDLEDGLAMMSSKCVSLTKDANRSRVVDLEKKQTYQLAQITKLKKTTDKLRAENKKMKMTMENLKNDNNKMKKEYEKLFFAALREKKKQKTEREKSIKKEIETHFRESAQKSPHITEYYKKRLKDKEKEVEELTKRVRRMILSEHRGNIVEKNFELERTRLKSEVKLLKKLYMPSNSTNEMAFRHQFSRQNITQVQMRNQELEEKLRDYEQLKAANRTQTQAYNRLQQQQSVMQRLFSARKSGGTGDASSPSKSSMAHRPERGSPQGKRNKRPQSAWSGAKRSKSAGPSRSNARRPASAKIGSSRSSMRVGSLL